LAQSEFFDDRRPRGGIGGHQSAEAETQTWLTPPSILAALGPFELDPCAAPEPRPWPTAEVMWTREDNSLNRKWSGRVWCNPPYGGPDIIGPWLRRMADHGQGTALTFARTETAVFFETVWGRATALLFLKGRLTFCTASGRPGRANAGGPSVLIAYGAFDSQRLRGAKIPGHFVAL
jgi:hypothetical protein